MPSIEVNWFRMFEVLRDLHVKEARYDEKCERAISHNVEVIGIKTQSVSGCCTPSCVRIVSILLRTFKGQSTLSRTGSSRGFSRTRKTRL
jgi:hypothetical protein